MMQFHWSKRICWDRWFTDSHTALRRGKNRNISFLPRASDLIVENMPANIISACQSVIRALIFLQALSLELSKEPNEGCL